MRDPATLEHFYSYFNEIITIIEYDCLNQKWTHFRTRLRFSSQQVAQYLKA